MQRHDTDGLDRETLDREMMTRCLAVAVRSGQEGEYPYGVVICRAGNVVAESTNRVAHEHDVTRHAEVVIAGPEDTRHCEPRRLRDLRQRGALRLLLLSKA